MSPLGPEESHVLICDWKGRLQWSSKAELYPAYGELAWNYVVEGDRERYRDAFSRTLTQHRRQQIDVECAFGGYYRGWLWPLEWPDAAVCILAVKIPRELKLLTPREHECLVYLSRGLSVNDLARKLDVSASTVHTLLRRARVKLKLRSSEELASFAARYCFPKVGPLMPPQAAQRKRPRPAMH